MDIHPAVHPAIRQLQALFAPTALLCIMLLPKAGGAPSHLFHVMRELVSDKAITALTKKNENYHIYVSMASFKADTTARRKENVDGVTHVFIDIDHDGDEALQKLQVAVAMGEVPPPTIIIESSPHKYQAIWNVSGFSIETQEAMNHALASRFGADPASTDTHRVLRLAGFKNLKPEYDSPVARIVEINESEPYSPADFHIAVEAAASPIESVAVDDQTIAEKMKLLTEAMNAAAVNYYPPKKWAGGFLFELESCPWSESHTVKGTMATHVGVQESGAYDFKCKHSHCVGKTWADFKQYLESKAGHSLQFSIPAGRLKFGTTPSTPSEPSEPTPKSVPTAAVASDDVIDVVESNTPDMPEAVLEGRLGEICQKRLLAQFPVAYAWPTLVTVAGVMVPRSNVLGNVKTNLYTATVGPIHSGKSQAIKYACSTLGLPDSMYSNIKAGSPEGLLMKMSKLPQVHARLMDIDEWKHYFQKAGIDGSSFMTILNTNFYDNQPRPHDNCSRQGTERQLFHKLDRWHRRGRIWFGCGCCRVRRFQRPNVPINLSHGLRSLLQTMGRAGGRNQSRASHNRWVSLRGSACMATPET
jgi:RepB DNA-primase from phage plasmid